MEDHLSATAVRANRFDAVITLAGAFPPDAVLDAEIRAAREDRHPVGHDERGVEADAELADELRILRVIGCEAFEKLAGPRLGNRADVLDDILARHTDAVV